MLPGMSEWCTHDKIQKSVQDDFNQWTYGSKRMDTLTKVKSYSPHQCSRNIMSRNSNYYEKKIKKKNETLAPFMPNICDRQY